jgi:hypothetical protein
MRHGRPVPASHRKPNQGSAAASSKPSSSGDHPAPAAKTPAAGSAGAKSSAGKSAAPARQPSPAKSAAPAKTPRAPRVPIDPDADLRDPSVVAIEEDVAAESAASPRARTRTRSAGAPAEGHRRRKGSEPSRNPIIRGLRGYFGAYVPLFIVFCILFVGVFVYTTVTHTPTAQESWNSISEKWKPQRDAARAKVFVAAEKGDVPGQMAAYKELASLTRSWADELEKSSTHWTANAETGSTNEQAASGVLEFITASRALAIDIEEMTKIGTADALAQYSDKLTADDNSWNQDYRALVYIITGTDPMANTSPVATLMLPSQAPTASATASPAAASPDASASTAP